MTRLKVGTRGSDLALWQTNWVCERLRKAHPDLEIEQIIIKTHGDEVTDQNFGSDWPAGAFVSALENALLENRIDFAVHSYKDLQTAETPGLVVAATPQREVVHDVLLTRDDVTLDALPQGARIGTNSPRRAAQFLAIGNFNIVPIRGNVPTRIAKIKSENLDGIVLAAAGVKRLGIDYEYTLELPTDRFLPAPAQGALAVQTRLDDPAQEIVSVLEDVPTRCMVTAERAILSRINAGCHTPVAALAAILGDMVTLCGKLFSDDYKIGVESVETGTDPKAVGEALADRMLAELRSKT
jgi:hydroxymethylbilane synthase